MSSGIEIFKMHNKCSFNCYKLKWIDSAILYINTQYPKRSNWETSAFADDRKMGLKMAVRESNLRHVSVGVAVALLLCAKHFQFNISVIMQRLQLL